MNVSIDLSQLLDATNIRRGAFDEIGQAVVVRAIQELHNQISREANVLKSTRQEYKRNINRPVIGRLEASITLTGTLPNMIEQGAEPFDMKLGFSKSSKKKVSKGGGWYLTIPFRHASAGAIGESEAFSNVMPPEVYRMARALKSTITAPFFGTIRSGDSLKSGQLAATKYGVLGKRDAINSGGDLTGGERKAYTHKSSIYEGMIRKKKFYQLLSQGSYVTFRRVSSKSAVNSWIHKGITAHNLIPKAAKKVDFNGITAKISNRILTSMGL